jgi:hypothetical protein
MDMDGKCIRINQCIFNASSMNKIKMTSFNFNFCPNWEVKRMNCYKLCCFSNDKDNDNIIKDQERKEHADMIMVLDNQEVKVDQLIRPQDLPHTIIIMFIKNDISKPVENESDTTVMYTNDEFVINPIMYYIIQVLKGNFYQKLVTYHNRIHILRGIPVFDSQNRVQSGIIYMGPMNVYVDQTNRQVTLGSRETFSVEFGVDKFDQSMREIIESDSKIQINIQ